MRYDRSLAGASSSAMLDHKIGVSCVLVSAQHDARCRAVVLTR
jgi:hypothetical protein